MNFARIRAIAARKFASLRRDKRTFGFIVIMPAIQIVLMGIAIGQVPTGLDIAIINDGATGMGAIITDHLMDSESLVVHADYGSVAEARDGIEAGEIWAALHITPDGTLELHLDNSNQQVSATILVEVRNAMTAALEEQGNALPLAVGSQSTASATPPSSTS